MKRTLVTLVTVTTLGWGSLAAASEPTPATVPTKQEIEEEVATGVRDELSGKRAPKWKFTYTGDLEGEVSGTIATAMPGPFSTAFAGGSMNADRTGSAPQKVQGSIFSYEGQPTRAMLTLHLLDGTQCRTKPTKEQPLLSATIVDAERKTFHATFSGTLVCGEKQIQIDGYLTKKRSPRPSSARRTPVGSK